MKNLTIAICSYNRAERLPGLIKALRSLSCPVPFDILIIDNNSTDQTQAVISALSAEIGPPVRTVIESEQGIPFARNRAITESINSTFLLFIDDDELPSEKMLERAVYALDNEGAECVGGKIDIDFSEYNRPTWLTDDLLPFFGKIDYGHTPFWIKDESTPIWSGIVAYRNTLFLNNPELRFDHRYNRKGQGIGGGSDRILFEKLLSRNTQIRYQPGMSVQHFIEEWKLKRSYFLKLHFISGRKTGQFEMPSYPRQIFGVPPFLITEFFRQVAITITIYVRRQPGVIRQAMNASYTLGNIWGKYISRSRVKAA
ncbi:MAG: glycosyltransferase [Cellvibrionales bacterium]|nr:MAG: glycosyltransferase [Cellvibrionales bacterium]